MRLRSWLKMAFTLPAIMPTTPKTNIRFITWLLVTSSMPMTR